ncbi:S-adenosyl-L-methionine-dependent methyltransferase [Stereum hirsutum FP-91666 SS1]|uniref:S-adenosyl-L-methionine-dependent methyltransferase n=1 Tax=Stereum hirsutum (strain FP-91666) TaxID=721885 RepID=UPI000444A8CC|nr:S-adenosyl-L-methionine-dependent methyltransferase [Stereum hirsutum FP-91666 SS1]EIM82217.1 S-adenosyl-L-methionine-dependent methyltransferase [Stereum hirsutum FP-91666 SS1]
MANELAALSSLVSKGTETIIQTYSDRGRTFPTLDDPKGPSAIEDDRQLAETINIVLAAAAQLIEMLRKPSDVIMDTVYAMHVTPALRIAVETGIAELLRESEPEGLHIDDFGKFIDVDKDKLGRCLRFLCARHIFKEVRPNVFANNRISAMLDTGKPHEAIRSRPLDKFENIADGTMAAFVSHAACDPLSRGSVELVSYLLDPASSYSTDPKITPFSRGVGEPSDWFDYIERPGNERLLKNFGAAMNVSTFLFPKDVVTTAFDWGSLEKNEVVVDVGGGIGSCTLPLARAFPHLKYVVQDRAPVVEQGLKFWESEHPLALKEGLVRLEAHDFFQPQPIHEPRVFLLRFVLHDWPDVPSRRILQHLRQAAGPSTRVILLEWIVPYTCTVPDNDSIKNVPGSESPPVPYPLLPSLGPASSHIYFADMRMMNSCNAQERTIGQWIKVAEGTGWKLESVKRGPLCALIYRPE